MYNFNTEQNYEDNISQLLFLQHDLYQKNPEEEVPCKKSKNGFSDEENVLESEYDISTTTLGNDALRFVFDDAPEVNTQVAIPQVETHCYIQNLYAPTDDQHQLQPRGEVLLNYNSQVKQEEENDGNLGNLNLTQGFNDFGLTNTYSSAILLPDVAFNQKDTKLSPVESSSDGKISSGYNTKVKRDNDGDT